MISAVRDALSAATRRKIQVYLTVCLYFIIRMKTIYKQVQQFVPLYLSTVLRTPAVVTGVLLMGDGPHL